MKLLLTISITVLTTFMAIGQCTPDPNYTSPGYYSSAGLGVLVNAQKGAFYDETITVVAPVDTFGLTVDSIVLIRVKDLPTGLTYTTSSNVIKGGTSECIQLTGTPSASPGDYFIKLDVKIFVRGFPAEDKTESLKLFVDFPAGVDVNNFDNAKVSISPNPVTSHAVVNLFNFSASEVEFVVYNMVGNEVLNKSIYADSKNAQISFDVSDLPEGLYMYNVKVGEEVKVGRLIVSKK